MHFYFDKTLFESFLFDLKKKYLNFPIIKAVFLRESILRSNEITRICLISQL